MAAVFLSDQWYNHSYVIKLPTFARWIASCASCIGKRTSFGRGSAHLLCSCRQHFRNSLNQLNWTESEHAKKLWRTLNGTWKCRKWNPRSYNECFTSMQLQVKQIGRNHNACKCVPWEITWYCIAQGCWIMSGPELGRFPTKRPKQPPPSPSPQVSIREDKQRRKRMKGPLANALSLTGSQLRELFLMGHFMLKQCRICKWWSMEREIS